MSLNLAVFAAEATGGGPPAPNGRMLPHDIKELLWGSIGFSIVAALMIWKLLPVIKKALNDGQANAISEATAADQALAASAAQEEALRLELGDAEAESQRIIAEAHETANQLRVDQNARTQQLVNSMWERAQAEVSSLGTQATSDMSGQVSVQALDAAEAVVVGNLDDATHVSLIEDYISKVGAAS